MGLPTFQQQAFDMITATMEDRLRSLKDWKDQSIGLECNS